MNIKNFKFYGDDFRQKIHPPSIIRIFKKFLPLRLFQTPTIISFCGKFTQLRLFHTLRLLETLEYNIDNP